MEGLLTTQSPILLPTAVILGTRQLEAGRLLVRVMDLVLVVGLDQYQP